MGDAVNLAARLMAKAEPGEILTTPDLLARSQTGFEATELEPFFVKGKAKPVRAVRLGAKTRDVSGGHATTSCRSSAGGPELAAARGDRGACRPRRPGGDRRRHRSRKIAALAGRLREVDDRPDAAVRRLRALRLVDPVLHGAATAPRPARASGRRERRRARGDLSLAELEQPGARSPPVGPAHRHGHRRSRCPRLARRSELEEEFRRTKLAEAVIALLAVLLAAVGTHHH